MLSAFSVKRPYTILVAVILVIVLGIVSFTGMTTDLLPSINLPYVIVITSYPGASPEQVETAVTRPLESLLGTSGGLNNISSVSNENASTIILEYTQSTNMDSALIEISGTIDMIADQFPDTVGRPMLMRISPDMLPIMIASVDMEDLSLAELSDLVNDELLPHFERINGMAAVSADGMLEEFIHVSLSEDKIKALNEQILSEVESQLTETREELVSQAKIQMQQGESDIEKGLEELDKAAEEALKQADLSNMITTDSISQIIQAQNFGMPAGYIQDAENQILVKVGDPFSSREELASALLFSVDPVGDIRLSDIADISIQDNSDDQYARINGQPGIVLSFQKQSEASTAEVTGRVHDEIKQLTQTYEGLQIVPLMDQGEYINMITSSVLQNLLWGGLLAILVLMLFLKDIRPTLVIAFSIPISLMFAITLMYFSQITLNIVSLSGLALAVGMLVDNSIVVIENIYRMRSEGVPAAQAAVKGARQVSGAIFASTLTTICVFLPIVFTDGMSRDLFSDMGLTIAFSLIASLLVALTLVPTLSSTMLKANKEKSHPWFDAVSQSYKTALSFTLKFKPVVLIAATVLLALSLYGATIMGLSFIPEIDSPQMSVSLTLPPEESPGQSVVLVDEINERIMTIDAVEYVGALSGGFNFTGGGDDEITFYVLLSEDRDLSNRDVERIIYEKTEELNVDLVVSASTMDLSMLGGSGIQLIVRGENLDSLAETSEALANLIREADGIQYVEWQGQDAETELRVIVDKDKAMAEGLTVVQVFQELSGLLQADRQASTLSDQLHEWPVLVANLNRERTERATLADYMIETTDFQGDRTSVRLGDIADIQEAYSPSAIRRENQARYMTVSAQVADGYNVSLVSRDIEDLLDEFEIPEGFSVTLSGETETIMDAMGDLLLVLALAILFIYLIMVAQFQNLLAPFIILFTIPLAFTGGLLMIWVLGFDLSVIAMLGFLVLAGIVVNNGIVFISTVNQLRLEGMEKREALLVTGTMRIRPIIMTALTTILAMSTLALGIGSGAEMTQPMAIVTIGGLSYATLLTLFIVPVLYDLVHRKPLKKIDVGDFENET